MEMTPLIYNVLYERSNVCNHLMPSWYYQHITFGSFTYLCVHIVLEKRKEWLVFGSTELGLCLCSLLGFNRLAFNSFELVIFLKFLETCNLTGEMRKKLDAITAAATAKQTYLRRKNYLKRNHST